MSMVGSGAEWSEFNLLDKIQHGSATQLMCGLGILPNLAKPEPSSLK